MAQRSSREISSSHKTLVKSRDAFLARWKAIAALGASYENANNRFVTLDIPSGKDVVAI
jgi:hypothetical protein